MQGSKAGQERGIIPRAILKVPPSCQYYVLPSVLPVPL